MCEQVMYLISAKEYQKPGTLYIPKLGGICQFNNIVTIIVKGRSVAF